MQYKIEVSTREGKYVSTFYREHPREVQGALAEWPRHRFALFAGSDAVGWAPITRDELDLHTVPSP